MIAPVKLPSVAPRCDRMKALDETDREIERLERRIRRNVAEGVFCLIALVLYMIALFCWILPAIDAAEKAGQ